jgi:hypothetical protein
MKLFLIIYENTAWGSEYASVFTSLDEALAEIKTTHPESSTWIRDSYSWTMGRDTIRIETFEVKDPEAEYIFVVNEKHTSGYSKILQTFELANDAKQWISDIVQSGTWKEEWASSKMEPNSWMQVAPYQWQSKNMSVGVDNIKIRK